MQVAERSHALSDVLQSNSFHHFADSSYKMSFHYKFPNICSTSHPLHAQLHSTPLFKYKMVKCMKATST